MIICKHCGKTTRSSTDVARVVGWRMFSGLSLTGKQLEDVVCPQCAGTAAPPEEQPSWRVRCKTCDWEYEDEFDEGPLDAKAARELANDHECEPWVEVCPPDSERWMPPSMLNKDGSIRDDPRLGKLAAVGA